MAFPDRLKLPLSFDPPRLERDLAMFDSTDWIAHFVPQNYDGDWSAIALRGTAGARHLHPIRSIYSDPLATEFEDMPALDRCVYFREVVSAFACDLRSVRLMRLTPGSTIKEHSDRDLDFESGVVRIHVPIITNAGATFELNRIPLEMAPGETWYLRLSDPHRAANRGATDRVHLVIDAHVNDWLRDLFARSQLAGDCAEADRAVSA